MPFALYCKKKIDTYNLDFHGRVLKTDNYETKSHTCNLIICIKIIKLMLMRIMHPIHNKTNNDNNNLTETTTHV